MTGAPSADPNSTQWFYSVNNQKSGPVSYAQMRQIVHGGPGQSILVWREGMSQWAPALSVPELAVPDVPTIAPVVVQQAPDRRVRNAKQNCITLFVVLCLGILTMPLTAMGVMPPCIGAAILLGGIYAAIYFPLRWRLIMSLPPAYKVLGLIGGIGLVAFLLLGIIGVVLIACLGGVHGYVNH